MADDLEPLAVRASGRDISVGRKNIFQRLPRTKVAKFLSRIQHPANSQQVTLLADAVASSMFQIRRIDDRARPWITEMPFSRAMTTLTRDRFRRKWGRAILV